jgi:hypothetical protein
VETVLLPSLCLPPRVAALGVERWGVGTPRKTQGSGRVGHGCLLFVGSQMAHGPTSHMGLQPRENGGGGGCVDWGSQMSP